MKVYHLTIAFNEETEDIEYIEESLDDASSNNIAIATIDKEDYERTSTIEAIMKLKKVAEA